MRDNFGTCQRCGSERIMNWGSNKSGSKRVRCKDCGKTMSPDGFSAPGGGISRTTTLYDSDGGVRLQWVREDDTQDKLEALREAAADIASMVPEREKTLLQNKPGALDDLLAVYPVGDYHFGMLAWWRESGESYDCNIAAERLRDAFSHLVGVDDACDHALIVMMGDVLHANDNTGVTPANKHRLDTDGRWPKVVRRAIVSIVTVLDLALEHYASVDVMWKRGNHDPDSGLMLGEIIRAWYRNEPRINITIDPSQRSYMLFGKVLIGATHGDKERTASKLPLLMAAEEPELWGRSKHRHIFMGHYHKAQTEELPGCTVETVRAISPRDAYASGAGYLSHQALTKVIFSKDVGEVERLTYGFNTRKEE